MAHRVIPSVTRKWSVTKLINNFREGCSLVTSPIGEVGPEQILVKNRYVGVNASDINVPAGRYDPNAKPPFDIGFEGVGEVLKVGSGCQRITPGQSVAHYMMGAYSEYQVIPEAVALKVPAIKPEYVSLLVSGLGVSTGLDVVGEIRPTDTVLVTAASGGAGQIAVQYAKAAGCHVIGTCSTDAKAEFLKDLGCDRSVNYKKENLHTVLSSEYKSGVDVIFEGVAGELLVHGVNNIAQNGRVVLYGAISSYEDPNMAMDAFPNLAVLILRSASIRGHLFFHQAPLFVQYMDKLLGYVNSGKLRLTIDNGSRTDAGVFKGLNDVPRAVEYLYSAKHLGKIVVDLFPE